MAKYIKPQYILPADAKFFIIPLPEDSFKLRMATLNKYYSPLPKKPKDRYGKSSRFISFRKAIATISVSMPNETDNLLFVHVEIGELHVSCQCGRCDFRLCPHAYYGLLFLMNYQHEIDLRELYWPEVTSEVKNENRFLDVRIWNRYITVKPKKEYGNVFRPGFGFYLESRLQFHEPSFEKLFVEDKRKEVVVFCLAYNYSKLPSSHLPFILPVLGLTDNKGTEVIRFVRILDKSVCLSGFALDERALRLIALSQEMYTMVTEEFSLETKEADRIKELRQHMLELWQKAIPDLNSVVYLYAYLTYGFKGLKHGIQKIRMSKVDMISTIPSSLSFVLKDHGDHFQMNAIISNNHRKAEIAEESTPFFTQSNAGRTWNLTASVQDDEVMNWMNLHHNVLTIMKPHFVQFHERFLSRLSDSYTIYFVPYRSRQRHLYDYGSVLKEIGFVHDVTNTTTAGDKLKP